MYGCGVPVILANRPFGMDVKLVQSRKVAMNMLFAGFPRIVVNRSGWIDVKPLQPENVSSNMDGAMSP